MVIVLRRVECVTTYGEAREEPCLHWRIDEDDEQVGYRGLGDRGMRPGQSVGLDIQLEAERVIEVRLTEYDGADHRYDDCLGTVRFVSSEDEEGARRWSFVDLANDRGQHYRLYYNTVTEGEVPGTPWVWLHLHEIRCGNAQQWKDYVYLTVNGRTVWGPERMRDTGDAAIRSVDFDEPVPPDTVISLWEEDVGRDDHVGSFELRVDEAYDFGRVPEPIRFHYDRGGTNATYYLTYSVTRQE